MTPWRVKQERGARVRGKELLELPWLGGGRKGASKAVSSSQESCSLHLPAPDSTLCPAHQDNPFLQRLECLMTPSSGASLLS